MIRYIRNQPQQKKLATPTKSKKSFTLGTKIVYFPATNVVSSRRVDVVYDDERLIVGFQSNKTGRCCITKSKGRAHICISKSNGLNLLKKYMPQGTYIPIKWNNVPAALKAKSTLTKSDRIFMHDSIFPTGGGSPTSVKKFKKKRVSKSTRDKISSSLRAHYRGRKRALKK